jgi:hypothetical protein
MSNGFVNFWLSNRSLGASSEDASTNLIEDSGLTGI